MKELQVILELQKRIANENGASVLATVVDVKGSSYRLPGAKMLITETGESFGTVSGGCLEADVLERAKQVLKTGVPQVFVYDTTGTEDSVFSLNMGCRGVIRILLESVEPENLLFRILNIASENRARKLIATIISTSDEVNLPVGGRVFYDLVEQFNFKNVPDVFEFRQELLKDCEISFNKNNAAHCKSYKTEKGNFEFFFEIINPPPHLLVFGAGADSVSLAELAKNLGWYVSVIDHRPAFATRERFSTADEIILSRPENLKLSLDENSVAVVMTHNYELDKQILQLLLKSDASYVGALGPKRRTESLLLELWETGGDFGEKDRQKLYAPVGLDIGADTPETIALSIIAEIQSVLARREGGFLRNRKGSIYNR